jgi:hypothetical protein
MSIRSPAIAFVLVCAAGVSAGAQAEYRNLEGGRPVRIADATPTERNALELDLTSIRVDRLSLGRYRLQIEPRVSYGILPRTEISLRALGFYRERSATPRGTVAGFGIGGEYLLKMESLRSPAISLAGEMWIPTGPNSSRNAYSVKGLVTRSFPAGRVHLNASYGTYAIRVPVPPPGQSTLIPPIVDGPCMVSPASGGLTPSLLCMGEAPTVTSAAALRPGMNTGVHWLAGIGADHSFPLRSILIVADVFTERYEGIGRPTDWTAELGGRAQITPRFVADVGIGRRFRSVSQSWFVTFGTTISLAIRR